MAMIIILVYDGHDQASGVRVVFDDSGEVLDPLALLASNANFGDSAPHADRSRQVFE
jgi:hypothetical protein